MDPKIIEGLKSLLSPPSPFVELDHAIRAVGQSILDRAEPFERKKTRLEEDMKRGSRLCKHPLPL